MAKRLFLLDGMALVYRGHFALAARPIMTSKGLNTSAIFVFAQTLIDLVKRYEPTHLAVVFDTAAPTFRHTEYPEYKAQREAMPEELSAALPAVRRMIEGFRIPVLTLDGWEADDVIGTLARRADAEGFETFMVTPDKDFGQLVTETTKHYRPSRMGDGVEILGISEVCEKWGVARVGQVIDMLGLQGDASDNIPGVPGVGPKTARKLIADYDSVENLLEHTAELKGKLKERLEENRAQALLSKRLATIDCHAPISLELEELVCHPLDEPRLRALFVEFEFNALGRRLFGEEFKAGRGYELPGFEEAATAETSGAALRTIADVPHDYRIAATPEERSDLVRTLAASKSFCFDTETTGLDPKSSELVGLAFSVQPGAGWFVPMPSGSKQICAILREFAAVFENEDIAKIGHNLKFDLTVLRWCGVQVRGKLFDTMLAHALIEADVRHGLDYLAESLLGYAPIPIAQLIGEKGSERKSWRDAPLERLAEYAVEAADISWQLKEKLAPMLGEKSQEKVFFEIESPLLPVLVEMEFAGITLDTHALGQVGDFLQTQIAESEAEIFAIAGEPFNLNSPKQLGEVLFDRLQIGDAPKKTKTGQYATNEQTLLSLAGRHRIIDRILSYREANKLKTTYVDTLPGTISARSGRIHTTYNQAVTATGRLQSQDPNLQNIPIRGAQGREIRRAFVPRGPEWEILAADYSQIELRIIAALSGDQGMLAAFEEGIDIHTATAAKVFGVELLEVTPEMRRRAKMVNFGIAYGISAFGLAQRLGIPRGEASEIISSYFAKYQGIRRYMDDTIAFARENGYVETVTGRRRYLRDIRSKNGAVRGGAERNAINAPIQGTAADMIKLAMVRIQAELTARKLATRMVLQVHDELVFDLLMAERDEVRQLVSREMRRAIPLKVPIVVEMGTGRNWLEAH